MVRLFSITLLSIPWAWLTWLVLQGRVEYAWVYGLIVYVIAWFSNALVLGMCQLAGEYEEKLREVRYGKYESD